MAAEFEAARLNFEREAEQDIFYKEWEEPIGRRSKGFIVEKKVLLELKTIIQQ